MFHCCPWLLVAPLGAMTMCGSGGVTPLNLKLGQIREISGPPPGRFTPGEGLRLFIRYEGDVYAHQNFVCTCVEFKEVQQQG
jgi:hypothetical protein